MPFVIMTDVVRFDLAGGEKARFLLSAMGPICYAYVCPMGTMGPHHVRIHEDSATTMPPFLFLSSGSAYDADIHTRCKEPSIFSCVFF